MNRIKALSLIMVFFLLITVAGLIFVQVFMYEKYKAMSEDNRLKIVPLPAPRGGITDRNGEDLVKDELAFNVSLKYPGKNSPEIPLAELASAIGVKESVLQQRLSEAKKNPFVSLPVAMDVGIEKAIRVAEIGSENPGIVLDVTSKRRYFRGRSSSNILGYVGLINREELEILKPYGFRMDDLMGRSGLERYYDDYLRGRHGGKQVEVDNRGREVRVLGLKEPAAGKSLKLTVDAGLQDFCDSLLEGRAGAIVVMSPETGEIYALSSAPNYDPNIFVNPSRGREVSGVLKDRGHPLLNRAVSGVYPLGSVFKLVMATAGIETGVISPNTHFNCSGSISSGGRVFHCWNKDGHGEIDVKDAIKVSCNVFFWRIGLLLGPDRIASYASKMGMGSLTGVDLPFEAAGTLPSESWKKKTMKDEWYTGETMNYSVGQGYFLCTPIQTARMVSVLANGGYLVRPYIVEEIDGVSVARKEKIPLGISGKTMDTVREGMRRSVNESRGTGVKARQKDFVVAGKTGTAQTSRDEDHAWFAGFGPFDRPKLTVVVFAEYGGKGGYFSAETAGKIFSKAKEMGII